MGGSVYNLRVVSAGFDTVEGAIHGTVPGGVRDVLELLKRQAQERERPVPFPLLDGLAVQPHGLRPYAWILGGADYHLRLGRVRSSAFGFRMLSVGLASRGVDELLRAIRSDATGLLVDSHGLGHLSRVDAYCDLQGWKPRAGVMAHVVCPSGFRPVYPSVAAPETFQYGKGAIVVRVYNKTREQAAKGGHWSGVWAACPEYDPAQDVWRVEVQLRREALKQYGLAELNALSSPRPFFVAGLRWASLRRRKRGDSNPSRWPLHPVWEFLEDRYAWTDPVRDCSASAALVDVDRLIPQLVGILASCGARVGEHEPLAVWDAIAPMVERYLAGSESFSERVAARQVRAYGRTFCGELPRASAPRRGVLARGAS